MTELPVAGRSLDSLRNPRAALVPRHGTTRLDGLEQQARRKRLLLVSTLAGFLALFGLTVYQDQAAQPATAAAVPASAALPASTSVGSSLFSSSGSTIAAPASQPARTVVRTRTRSS